MANKIERLEIKVSTEEKELWKAVAAQKGISMAELIRRAVKDYLTKETK